MPPPLPTRTTYVGLTKKVNHFITPIPQGEGMAPPAVRFTWGSFLFEGVMDSMDETLEFFSADGRPLRAKVSISITSQEIQFHEPPPPSSGGDVPGTSPQQQAQEGDSLQAMVGRDRGRGAGAEGWQAVAAANGIENPRRLEPGTFVDLNAARQTDAGEESPRECDHQRARGCHNARAPAVGGTKLTDAVAVRRRATDPVRTPGDHRAPRRARRPSAG